MTYFRVLIGLFLFSSSFASAEDEMRVGVIQSLSGVAQSDGEVVVNSLQLAASEINATSDLKIRLLVEDDTSVPKNSISAYEKLRLANVEMFIGGTWSFLVRAILPLAVRDKIVLMNSSNFAEIFEVGAGKGYFFTNALPAAEHVSALMAYIKQTQPKTAALVSVNTPWGVAQENLYKKALAESGIKVILAENSDRIETNDWRDIMPKIQGSKPDIVILATGNNDVDSFLKRAREVKFQGKIFGSTHTLKAYNLSSTKSGFEGVCFPYPIEQFERNKSFVDAYLKRYKEEPSLYAVCSYDSLFILHRAFEESRKANKPLNEMLRTLSFPAKAGEYRYSDQHSLGGAKAALVCMENGKMIRH